MVLRRAQEHDRAVPKHGDVSPVAHLGQEMPRAAALVGDGLLVHVEKDEVRPGTAQPGRRPIFASKLFSVGQELGTDLA